MSLSTVSSPEEQEQEQGTSRKWRFRRWHISALLVVSLVVVVGQFARIWPLGP